RQSASPSATSLEPRGSTATDWALKSSAGKRATIRVWHISLGSRENVVHVHLIMRVDDLDREVQVLERQGGRLVSPGIVTLAGGERAVMVRDPDGHMLLLEQ